jgi:uncharacterized protein GlcG (DUF336 family)
MKEGLFYAAAEQGLGRTIKMRGLSLEEANTIIAVSFAEAKKRKCRPMSAIVLDAGDRVKAFQKQDGASMLRVEICYGKAEGARKFMQSIENLADYPLFLEGGGQLIRDKFGEVLGAIGVTATPTNAFMPLGRAPTAISTILKRPLVDPHQHASPRRGAVVLRDGGNGSGRRSGAQNAKSGP